MADVKSFQTLISELKTHVRARNRYLDVSDNAISQDIVVIPQAIGGRALMNQVAEVQTLNVLATETGQGLIGDGSNYTLEQLTGRYSTVPLTFWTPNRPTTDITINAATQARTVGTSFETAVTFSVTTDAVFPLTSMDAYYSHDRGRYEFTARAQCISTGSAGNVGANLINQLVTSVPQISGVTNLVATNGGEDLESEDDFRERLRMKKIGTDRGVVYGMRGYLLKQGFIDASIIRVEQPGYERAAGADAFVIDFSSEAATDTFTYYSSQSRYYFSKRPVLDVSSVVAASYGPVPLSQYNVHIDQTSPERRSVNADDYIEFVAPTIPDGTSVTVVYNYSSAIYQAQQTLDLTLQKLLAVDMLLKRAYPCSLYLTAKLTLKANVDGPSTRNKVRNALSQYMATYRLGAPVQESDLIVVLQDGYGDFPIDVVDAVQISSFYLLDELGMIYTPINWVIALTNKQHCVYGSAVLS